MYLIETVPPILNFDLFWSQQYVVQYSRDAGRCQPQLPASHVITWVNYPYSTAYGVVRVFGILCVHISSCLQNAMMLVDQVCYMHFHFQYFHVSVFTKMQPYHNLREHLYWFCDAGAGTLQNIFLYCQLTSPVRLSLGGARNRLEGQRQERELNFPVSFLWASCHHYPTLLSAPWQWQVLPAAAAEVKSYFFQQTQSQSHGTSCTSTCQAECLSQDSIFNDVGPSSSKLRKFYNPNILAFVLPGGEAESCSCYLYKTFLSYLFNNSLY